MEESHGNGWTSQEISQILCHEEVLIRHVEYSIYVFIVDQYGRQSTMSGYLWC
jgi:hypothetical protein